MARIRSWRKFGRRRRNRTTKQMRVVVVNWFWQPMEEVSPGVAAQTPALCVDIDVWVTLKLQVAHLQDTQGVLVARMVNVPGIQESIVRGTRRGSAGSCGSLRRPLGSKIGRAHV